MEHSNENGGFQYSYSAREQAEVKRIREKYTPSTEEEDKLERLRRLDARATQRAQVVSLVFGMIGALVLGFGMSLCMTELGLLFLPGRTSSMVLGVLLGAVGGALAAAAYPMYQVVLRRERDKVAPEILRLTDELLK